MLRQKCVQVITPEQAVSAIRHVEQEHGDEHTLLGRAASLEGMKWFADRLEWSWPTSYVEVLSRHDGVLVQDANVYRFLESIDLFVNILHGAWHGPEGYWSVGGDGCGNYYALSMARHPRSDDSPVVFFEMIESQQQPSRTVAADYPEFVTQQMRAQCRDAGCTHLF